MATITASGITSNLFAVKKISVNVSANTNMMSGSQTTTLTNMTAPKINIPPLSGGPVSNQITNAGRFGVIDPSKDPKQNPWVNS